MGVESEVLRVALTRGLADLQVPRPVRRVQPWSVERSTHAIAQLSDSCRWRPARTVPANASSLPASLLYSRSLSDKSRAWPGPDAVFSVASIWLSPHGRSVFLAAGWPGS